MKSSYSFPFLFLLAAACSSDAPTAPSSARAVAPGDGVSVFGEPPPPPIDADIVVCAAGACAVYAGDYFSNSNGAGISASPFAQAQSGGVCTFPGHSYLKINEPIVNANYNPEADANAQIRCSQLVATGRGEIEFYANGHEVVVLLEQVRTFVNTPTCAVFCASFTADITVDGVLVPNGAQGFAFNEEVYQDVCGEFTGGGPSFCDPRNIGID
ncbi:MAG TPA: hypothetical protein VJT70_02525 [Sphingomicrobium sp.]|nr:hypothetical protein [Sphingomicrobium sp.]